MRLSGTTIRIPHIRELAELARTHPGAIDGDPEFVVALCERALDRDRWPSTERHEAALERVANIWNKYIGATYTPPWVRRETSYIVEATLWPRVYRLVCRFCQCDARRGGQVILGVGAHDATYAHAKCYREACK